MMPRRNEGRASTWNVIHGKPSVLPGIRPATLKEAFLQCFDNIIDDVVQFINLEAPWVIAIYTGQVIWRKYGGQQHGMRWRPLLVLAFLQVCIVHVISTPSVSDRNVMVLSVFHATMSRERFLLMERFFWFDNHSRRNLLDPMSPTRWEQFHTRLRMYYPPDLFLIIDEQLLEFHDKVKFRIHISSKSGKNGIKMVWLCEADTGYCLTAVPYTIICSICAVP